MKTFIRVLVPNAGTLLGALEIGLSRVNNPERLRDIAVIAPTAAKPWAQNIARSKIEAALNVMPGYTDVAQERAILIDLLAELDARRRGKWEE